MRLVLICTAAIAAIIGVAIADTQGQRCELRRDTVFITGRPALFRVCHGSITGLAGDEQFVRFDD